MDTTTLAVERAIPWQPEASMPVPWGIDVLAQAQIDNGLVLEVRITALEAHEVQHWHLFFRGCQAAKFMPTGAPGNELLTRPLDHHLSSTMWEIEGSVWLSKCGVYGISPTHLHHFVINEATRCRVWHVAAMSSSARRVEPGERLGAQDGSWLADPVVMANI